MRDTKDILDDINCLEKILETKNTKLKYNKDVYRTATIIHDSLCSCFDCGWDEDEDWEKPIRKKYLGLALNMIDGNGKINFTINNFEQLISFMSNIKKVI